MESDWPVSIKLTTESVGSGRELVAMCSHRQRRRDASRTVESRRRCVLGSNGSPMCRGGALSEVNLCAISGVYRRLVSAACSVSACTRNVAALADYSSHINTRNSVIGVGQRSIMY